MEKNIHFLGKLCSEELQEKLKLFCNGLFFLNLKKDSLGTIMQVQVD